MNAPTLAKKAARPNHDEGQTKEDLYKLAQEREVEGRSGMNKKELIQALRE